MHELHSARLKLRPMGAQDELLYCRIYTDATLMRHVGPAMEDEAAQRSFQAACRQMSMDPPRVLLWVMQPTDIALDIGLVALIWRGEREWAEIGAMVLAQAHRKGYAHEAMARVMEHGFEQLGLSGLWGHHPSSNVASTGLMEGLGFVRTPPTQPHLDHRWELPRVRWAEIGLRR